MSEDVKDAMGTFGQYIFLAIIVFIRPYLTPQITAWKKRFSGSFDKNAEIGKQISDKLIAIRVYFQANRLNIYEYSNGERSISGISREYVSCTYEKTDEHTSGIMHLIQKVPVSTYIDKMVEIKNSYTGVVYSDIIIASQDSYNAMRRFGIINSISVRMTNRIEDGVLSLSYTSSEKPFTDNQKKELQAMVYEVYQLMKSLKH